MLSNVPPLAMGEYKGHGRWQPNSQAHTSSGCIRQTQVKSSTFRAFSFYTTLSSLVMRPTTVFTFLAASVAVLSRKDTAASHKSDSN